MRKLSGKSQFSAHLEVALSRYSLWALLAVCVVAAGIAEPSSGQNHSGGDSLSAATQQVLKDHKLKNLVKRDPVEAIRTLDVLRSPESASEIRIAIAEVALKASRSASPHDAKGLFMTAAEETYSASLKETAGGRGQALELHGDAIEGLIGVLEETGSEALRGETDEIVGPLGRYDLTWVDAAELWTSATHDFEPASILPTKKKVRGLAVRYGLGVPVVAIRRDDDSEEPEREEGLFEIYKYYYPLTAVLELNGGEGDQPRSAVVRLLDPRLTESHEIAGNEYPLSIDIGAQFVTLERETDAIFAKKGLLKSGKYMSLTSLYLSEPLRPGKIPLVLTHGLSSSPVTWAASVSEFMLDPTIRQHYQVWFFAYPTGVAFPYTASLLRASLLEAMDRLDEVGESSASDRVVMIGHSMGGLLTRMQVTDTGTTLWDAVFTESPAEIDLPEEDVDELTRVLVVAPLPFVERVVFCSTPHRGSKYAANSAGKVGASLVRLPKETLDLSRRITLSAGDALTEGAAQEKKIPDSVQTLQPNDPVVLALNTLPIDSHVTYHTLVGDRGKGDSPDSSDGVVAYWSSHLDGAASEKIVPSDHGSHANEEGIEELMRILHLHLEEVN